MKTISIQRTSDFDFADLNLPVWAEAPPTPVANYWDGSDAPEHRSFEARVLWSSEFLYVRFDAKQGESFVMSSSPILNAKTIGLWDRDVCEIYVAPNRSEPRRYFEFEVAPTGEWVDLAIDLTSGERVIDQDFDSGLRSVARLQMGRVVMALRVPWRAFGSRPEAGDVWMGNLFRCVGAGPDRGYLAWSPTETDAPDFHVPERFGEFVFAE